MSEYIHLIGAEDVSKAGWTMRAAADEMKSAALSMDNTATMMKSFMDDWLYRFQQMLEDNRRPPDSLHDLVMGAGAPCQK